MLKKKNPRLHDLIPNEEYRNDIEQGLLSGKPLIGPNGIFTDLLQTFLDAALEGEMDVHLSNNKEAGIKNRRNGHISKKVKTKAGELDVRTPRDRNSDFNPMIVGKRQKEMKDGFEDIIIELYGKGNSVEDIHRILKKIYGISYSTSAISLVTERIWPKILEWQQRPLKQAYAIVYLDAMHYRVKWDGQFNDKAVYTVYGIDIDGQRDILGIYLDDTESASHWRAVLEDLSNRGVEDIFFVCIDGLKGFKDSIQQIYPQALVQRCIVHKVRNSMQFVSDKNKREMCADLKLIYTATNRERAAIALEAFEKKWGKKGEKIAEKWRADWDELMTFMDYSSSIRKMIYTTNPVEAIHRIVRKVTKSKGAWISERALYKQIYLTLQSNEKSWSRKAHGWKSIQSDLEDRFGERFSRWVLK